MYFVKKILKFEIIQGRLCGKESIIILFLIIQRTSPYINVSEKLCKFMHFKHALVPRAPTVAQHFK